MFEFKESYSSSGRLFEGGVFFFLPEFYPLLHFPTNIYQIWSLITPLFIQHRCSLIAFLRRLGGILALLIGFAGP